MLTAMKRLSILTALVSSVAMAVPLRLGVITATTGAAKNQTDTAAPFTIPPGQKILIECRDASTHAPTDAYLRWVNTTTGAATAATSLRASLLMTYNGGTYQYLSVLGTSVTTSCYIFAVDP